MPRRGHADAYRKIGKKYKRYIDRIFRKAQCIETTFKGTNEKRLESKELVS